MRTTIRRARAGLSGSVTVWMALALLALWPMTAFGADGGQQASPPKSGPAQVTVEAVESVFVAGPEVRFTELDGRNATLVGGFGGVLIDRTLLVGGAGYWLANGKDDFGMVYGGAIVQWHVWRDRTLNVSLGGLIGGGSATVSGYSYAWGVEAHEGASSVRNMPGPPHPEPPGMMVFVVDQPFLVFEPQVSLVWRVARGVSLMGGAGYRVIGYANGAEDLLRGVSGSVAIRFGGK